MGAARLTRLSLSAILSRREHLQPYLKDIFVLLLTRLTQSKTEKFTQAFIKAVMLPLAMRKPGLGPDVIYSHVEALQAGCVHTSGGSSLPELAGQVNVSLVWCD